MNGNLKKTLKISLVAGILILLAGSWFGYGYYQQITSPNVDLKDRKSVIVFISNNSDFEEVIDTLQKYSVLINEESFRWVAEQKNYPSKIKPGRYRILNHISNNELVNMLRAGLQEPVQVTFNNIRTKEQLASKISKQLEIDSTMLLEQLNDKTMLADFSFSPQNILGMFIPNTYEMYWNTTSEKFLQRMYGEYTKFWTDARQAKAEAIGLNPKQVSVLASIVQAEQAERKDEQPTVAGVYMNRIKKGMYLESCPTLIYAIGDFSIRRVLDKHREINSPYNTYKNPGLPPSVINLPEISAIDAVLNYQEHEYLFMCAKEDFSGYHYFSKTNAQHEAYARRFQAVLDKKGIYQ